MKGSFGPQRAQDPQVENHCPRKIRVQMTYLNIIMAVYHKPIIHINLSEEKPRSFPLKTGLRQGYALSVFINEVLAGAMRQGREIEGYKSEGKKSEYLYLQMV